MMTLSVKTQKTHGGNVLIETGFKYSTEMDGVKLFRKRK